MARKTVGVFTEKGTAVKAPRKVRSEYAVSAKRLGELNNPACCTRCFKIRHALRGPGRDTPFSFGMAGILSRLASLQQKLVYDGGELPSFLKRYADYSLVKASRMEYEDPRTGITLSGVPDVLFSHPKHGIAVVDFKSSKFKPMPSSGDIEGWHKVQAVYACQLNCYAHLIQALEIGDVRSLSLLYLWPRDLSLLENSDLTATFDPTEVQIQIDDTLVPRLLEKARTILLSKVLPPPRKDCLDCVRLAHLLTVIGDRSQAAVERDEAVLEDVQVFVP